jgi:predicted outer membrane protein
MHKSHILSLAVLTALCAAWPARGADRALTEPAAGRAPLSQMTEGEALGLMQASDRVQGTADRLAVTKARDAEVRGFAKRRADERAKELQQLDLAGGVQSSAASRTAEQSGLAELQRLQRAKGRVFDNAYIDEEVTKDRALLEQLDKAPNEGNNRAARVGRSREMIRKDLGEAQKLQRRLHPGNL